MRVCSWFCGFAGVMMVNSVNWQYGLGFIWHFHGWPQLGIAAAISGLKGFYSYFREFCMWVGLFMMAMVLMGGRAMA